MHTNLPRVRSALLRTVLSLTALALGQCGEPLIVLDIDPASVPAGITKLLLRTNLNGNAGKDQLFDVGQRGISIHLPSGTSGALQLDLVGLDYFGCEFALATLTPDVPNNLSRSTELTVSLTHTSVSLCGGPYGSNAYAVGDAGTVLGCPDGSMHCHLLNSGISQKLTSVWASDASNIYAVGAGGTVLRCSASSDSCTPLKSGMTHDLAYVWGADTSSVYAVGKGGTVLRCKAGLDSCTVFTTNFTTNAPKNDLTAVWGPDANHVYAVGFAGTVLYCAAGSDTCSALPPVTDSDLLSVWGSDANNVYAVGTYKPGDVGGAVLRCAAGSCTGLNSIPKFNFNAVWGSDASNVYVAGFMGTLLRCAAGANTCTALTSNTMQGLNSIWGNASNIYVAGIGGTVLRCAVPAGPCTALNLGGFDLNSVWGSSTGNVYAVGYGGTVLNCLDGGNTCTVLNSSSAVLKAVVVAPPAMSM